jgi:hypothetical protein
MLRVVILVAAYDLSLYKSKMMWGWSNETDDELRQRLQAILTKLESQESYLAKQFVIDSHLVMDLGDTLSIHSGNVAIQEVGVELYAHVLSRRLHIDTVKTWPGKEVHWGTSRAAEGRWKIRLQEKKIVERTITAFQHFQRCNKSIEKNSLLVFSLVQTLDNDDVVKIVDHCLR